MSSGLRCGAWLSAAALITGLCWARAVPAFESPDESAYYKAALQYAAGGPGWGLPLYPALLTPIIRLTGPENRPFLVEYNPSFRFVSNAHGRVNMFMHGRSEKTARADLARLALLRGVTLVPWIAALWLTFLTARWFFARDDLALATAVLCLSIPGLSFFASKVHPEALTAVLGAAGYAILTARVYGRLGRIGSWLLALVVMALAPFSDRQGFFVLLLMPFGLILAERQWRHAAIAAAALAVAAGLALALPAFSHLRYELWVTIIGSFLSPSNAGWFTPEAQRYLVFEVFPKLFFGFWGWLGQPSILLPAPLYAALAVAGGIGAAGLLLTRDRDPLTPEQGRAAWIFAAGVGFTLAPIIYANLFISRNSWHGRWLYPSVAPIMIAIVAGWRASARFARRRPYAAAAALLIAGAILEVLWLTSPGDAVRAGILVNHYGDRARLMSTISLGIVMLGAAAALAAVAPRLRWRPARVRPATAIAAAAWAGNLLLLAFFVVPLYRPLDAAGIAVNVRTELAEGETGRAGALFRIGRNAFPASAELRRLGEEQPGLLLTGADDDQIAELQGRIARGEALRGRAELMALARAGRVKGGLEPVIVRMVIARAESAGDPDLAEPVALLRDGLAPRDADAAAAEVIRAGGGTVLSTPLPDGAALLEGYTVHPDATGRSEVTVYFKPLQPWRGRVLWLQGYPENSDAFIRVDPAPPAFDAWRVGELAWDRFVLPAGVRFHVFAGFNEGARASNPVALGPVPR